MDQVLIEEVNLQTLMICKECKVVDQVVDLMIQEELQCARDHLPAIQTIVDLHQDTQTIVVLHQEVLEVQEVSHHPVTLKIEAQVDLVVLLASQALKAKDPVNLAVLATCSVINETIS